MGDENIQRTSAASAMDVGAQIALLACLLSNLKGREIFRGPHFGKTNSTPKKDDKSEGLRALRRVSWARTCDKANLVRPGAVLERAQTAESNENI